MGDRNNPIKFGPEWLRNMPRERSAARSNNSQNASSSGGPSSGPSAGPSSSSGGATTTNTTPTTTAPTTNNSNTPSKVLLAKQRYGREEMLALFDRNAEAPPELKFIDTLYQPRGKQPVALNNTFEDDVRDNLRGAPPIGAMASGDRFGMGRGAGRGNERRGGSRGAYVRQPSLGRGAMWHVGPRMLTSPYSGGPEDDSGPTRPWTNNNNLNNTNRNSGDQADWATKMFRNKRQGNNTNWRQPQSRDDGEEWRSSEAGRSRLLEKWDRDWGDRPSGEKPQSWNNRRTWGGDNQNNEENLPEWAIENAECGGTFDSSGAFHGYSNDDTNLPKHHESSYPLTRSHTHGSFPRPKVVEEGSEEWWASEKAKKLSPKRFDASDLKFKKQPGIGIADVASTSSNNNPRSSKEESPQDTPETQEAAAGPESSESNATGQGDNKFGKQSAFKSNKFTESKTFDALMRSDINLEEASDERGNFQSVIINSNNSLRQKHQHLVPAMSEASSTQKHNMTPSMQNNQSEMDHVIKQSHEELLADNQFDRGLYELEELSSCSSNSLITLTGLGLSSGLASLANSIPPNQNMIISMANPSGPSNHGMNMEIHGNKSNMQTAVVQPVHHPNMQPGGMNTGGMKTAGMNTGGMNTAGMNTGGMNTGGMNTGGMNTGGMNTGGMNTGGMNTGGMNTSGMNTAGMNTGGMNTAGMNTGGMNTAGMNTGGMNTGGMNPGGIQSGSTMQGGLQMPGMPVGMQPGMSGSGYPPSVVMQSNLAGMPSGSMQNMSGMATGGMPNMPGMQAPQAQTPGHQVHSGLQNVGITNSALNASLGLPIGGPNMGGQQHRMPLQGLQQQVMPNVGMPNNSSMPGSGMGGMGSTSMQGGENMPGFQPMPGMGNNMGNASLFLNSNANNTSMASTINDIPMSNHTGQNNILLHLQGLQGSQGPYGNPMYGNNTNNNLIDQWYYEDPERNVQGPFSSRDMLNWYRVGFFSPSLMVRRACETMMRPLGSYGPVVPFANVDNMMSGFPMSNAFELPQGGHENMLNAQPTMSLDVLNIANMNISDNPPVDLQFGSVGIMPNQNFGQPQQMVDSLWGQGPSTSSDLMWIQQPMSRTEPRVNNMSMYFWDQPSAINSNSLLPEEITKEMKTEDQILAQLRATQNIGQQPQPFLADLPVPSVAPSKSDDYERNVNATPNMEELQKLLQKETLTGQPNIAEEDPMVQSNLEKSANLEQSSSESSITKSSSQAKNNTEAKQLKAKDTDKTTKNKENNNTKNKSKKSKEEKKEEVSEVKTKEEDVNKVEKRSQESSPTKNKKEEKSNKKDIEKEKKEWIKEGFTIVKGPEKSTNKDNKKKAEEARLAEEAERKRKEEEKLAADEDKKKKQAETLRKQQEQQALQQQRQASESVVKKAPWSAVANQAMQSTNHDGLTLAEIQRLEREKKLEQMKEQQQMMQIIAQQQAAALAREQEMQAGLGWAKKKASNQTQGQSLTEIQAEARKQAFAAAAKTTEEADVSAPPQTNHAPWANTHNGVGGFWDTQPNSSKTEKQQESQKTVEQSQKKKKPTLTIASKKDTSPSVEFEAWCTNVLSSWSSKIDVPTFVGFLKDIESPYEVKDYVKCYLGETKESSDFARQFLERRSKLLRVGMVTPSDDLCSPAIAVNPRTPSSSEYQEVKGKGKKTKKNKMLKVDVRILGFSVTAAEDRINVGDIDTV